MPDQVPADVVAERYARLVDLQQRISTEENAKQVGTDVEVLIAESEGRKDAATQRLSGRAADNRLVHLGLPEGMPDDDAPRPGDMVTAGVTSSAPHHLIADSGVRGGTFEVRRTRSGDAWEAAQRAEAAGTAPAGPVPVGLGMPKVRSQA